MERDPKRLAMIDSILEAALDEAPERRGAVLDAACGGDAELRREVEGLIADAEAEPGPFDRSLGAFLPGRSFGAPTVPAPEVSFTGERLAHYRILSLVAEGGMGEVYLAEDDRMPRKVALKLLPLRFTRDGGRLQRFQLEARSASALNHPGIVTIYEVGEAEGVHFIASEYIEGETLRQILKRGPLAVAEATDVALQVVAALGVAHAAGLVHRDIKPENVMRRADGFVKVVDFGLVKLVDEDAASASVTGVGAVLGTARYMSPEQARGEEVDSRTDLFALGVVLYEMLSGRPPFRGETFAHAFRAVLNDPPVPLGEVCPSAPAELSRIVMKLLSKEREARYQTADELRAALRRFRRSLPQEASAAYAPAAPAPAPAAPEPLASVPKHAARVAGAAVLVALLAVAGWSATRGSRPTKSSPAWQDAVITKLTERLGAEVFPSLSPDGRLVVFEARSAG
ncbi:MAG: serine/threonine protein kinase, partial [Acidobacteria bacterium]|nr:serine/threonine protein kinase [Acidobacteriota bacterium]